MSCGVPHTHAHMGHSPLPNLSQTMLCSSSGTRTGQISHASTGTFTSTTWEKPKEPSPTVLDAGVALPPALIPQFDIPV